MKQINIILITFSLLMTVVTNAAPRQKQFRTADLPDSVYVGEQKSGHVQGIAYDKKRNCIYMSFTTRFLKVDMKGNIVASIERVPGHLGAMTLSPVDGKVYASLECIDDEIGQSVAKRLGLQAVSHEKATLYIAVIDVEKLTRIGMDSAENNVLQTFCAKGATEDYKTGWHGSIGIDGVAFVPCKGKEGDVKSQWQLCIAYGIKEDLEREDNDCQILITYNIEDFEKHLTAVDYNNLHQNGPEHPAAQYFIYTGNTKYGVQNLAYDAFTGKLFMFVYKGHKPKYPNCNFFTVDWTPENFATTYEDAVRNAQPLGGWNFKWGATGVHPFGDGWWYISENRKNKANKTQSCTARLYHWEPFSAKGPFVKVSDSK